MDIREIRQCAGMSQRNFSAYFGIPLGTLRNWEQGIAKPPEYVFNMISASIRRDKMINVETIKLIRMLDELAELSKNGFEDFSNATENHTHDKIYYAKVSDGCYEVVLESLIDQSHHEVISCYDSYTDEYTIRVVFDDDDVPYIEVRFALSDELIVIHDGRWYFA